MDPRISAYQRPGPNNDMKALLVATIQSTHAQHGEGGGKPNHDRQNMGGGNSVGEGGNMTMLDGGGR